MSTTTTKTINLSDQALGAVMLALQNSLLDQSDIVPVLRGFNFVFNDEAELVVSNPPTTPLPDTASEIGWSSPEED